MNINNAIKTAFENYQAGNLEHTIKICMEILTIQPDNINVVNLLSIISYQQKDFDSAIKYCKKLVNLNPTNVQAYYILGHSLQEKGEVDEAITFYQKCLQLNPDFADAYYNLGTLFQDKKQYYEAILYYQKALNLNPNDVDACYNLGRILQEIDQYDEAINYYQRALYLNPTLADAYNNIGIILQEKEQLDEAMSYFFKALQLNPNLPDAYNNIGTILQEKEQLDEAMSYFQKTIQLDSNFYKAYHNLGVNFMKMNQIDEALNLMNKALHLNPNDANIHFALGMAFLLKGDFNDGWKEYEWRWKAKDFRKRGCFRKPDSFSQPILNNLDIGGKTVLVYAEQGLGDEIQFMRYIPLLAEVGANIVIECHKELSGLLHSVEGVKHLIIQGEQLPEFDLQCPLLNLPLIFNTTLENIPNKVPYLSVNPHLIQQWKYKIQIDSSNFKVGLVWQGNPKHKNDRNRSIPFNLFSAFAQLPNITFYSLQKGKGSEQSKNTPIGMKFLDLTEEINDLSDTGALIENLDLIISVDTSIVHLAGALGKPVWTLLPFAPDWRWMLNRQDSPWYPTMRLFRQPSPGDWDSVMKMVIEELQKFISTKA